MLAHYKKNMLLFLLDFVMYFERINKATFFYLELLKDEKILYIFFKLSLVQDQECGAPGEDKVHCNSN